MKSSSKLKKDHDGGALLAITGPLIAASARSEQEPGVAMPGHTHGMPDASARAAHRMKEYVEMRGYLYLGDIPT